MSGSAWNILISGECRICLKYINFITMPGSAFNILISGECQDMLHINFMRMSGSARKILISGECQEMPEICLSFSDLDDCSCKQVYKDPVVLLYA